MYIITPYDKLEIDEETLKDEHSVVKVSDQASWKPSINSVEWVYLSRSVTLAKLSYSFMMKKLVSFTQSDDWSAIFHESPSSFQSYNVLLRVDTDFVVDSEASSTSCNLNPHSNEVGALESSYTRSMKARVEGPKALRRNVYKNIQNSSINETILVWEPVKAVISSLRGKFGRYALFFYNDLAPQVIGLVWRPHTFSTMRFSAMTAEYAKPLDDNEKKWKNDSLVIMNRTEILREMSEHYLYIITTVKIIDQSSEPPAPKRKKTEK